MRALAQDENLVKTLELEGLISRLDLSSDSSETRRPSYKELYPAGWATDTQAELVHREALTKIVNWPIDHNRKVNNQGNYWLKIPTVPTVVLFWKYLFQFDYQMACLLLFIIAVNADFYILENKKMVENIQMKFTMILQRYLRFVRDCFSYSISILAGQECLMILQTPSF